MNLLKTHPFAVKAHFESSIVLTYAFPKVQLESLIPTALTLDTFEEQFAFVAVAFVKVQGLRAAVLPPLFGTDFMLVGFRVFAKYKSSTGRNYRGLYILKSLTDASAMKWLGNAMTHYNYSKAPISFVRNKTSYCVQSEELSFEAEKKAEVNLPLNSVFTNWKAARKFAGPMPFTFGVEGREIVIVEGKRSNWIPQPIEVISQHVPLIHELGDGKLVSAFIVEDIPYEWKKGLVEKW